MSADNHGAPQKDTIFALSTAPVRAAVAIIRLSGSSCDAALTALGVTTPRPRAKLLCDGSMPPWRHYLSLMARKIKPYWMRR